MMSRAVPLGRLLFKMNADQINDRPLAASAHPIAAKFGLPEQQSRLAAACR